MFFKSFFLNKKILYTAAAVLIAGVSIFGAYALTGGNTSFSSSCSDFNGQPSSCTGTSGCSLETTSCGVYSGDSNACNNVPGCLYGTFSCSAFSGQGSNVCTSGAIGCTYPANLGNCNTYNGNQNGCTAVTGCGYESASCSIYNGNSGTCAGTLGCSYPGNTGSCSAFSGQGSGACTGVSGCSYPANLGICSGIGGGMGGCNAVTGCSYSDNYSDCSVFNNNSSSCNSNVGCSYTPNTPGDCGAFGNVSSCTSVSGCTANYGNGCANFNGDEGSCNANVGCTWDGNDSTCSGNYFSTCSGTYDAGGTCSGLYVSGGTCSGSYDDGSCTGSYDDGSCAGSYYTGTCGGSYDDGSCTGTYNYCGGNYQTGNCVGTYDNTAPVLQSATVNEGTLTLTYDESLDTGSVPSGSDFSVTVNGNSNIVSTVSIPGGATVVLGLLSVVVQVDTVVIGYPGAASPIQDLAGNDASSFSGQAVTNNSPDITAPVLQNATVNGLTLTLTYNESLDAGSVPTTGSGAFSILLNGNSSSINSINVTGATVVIGMGTTVVQGDGVIISYINNSSAIQDLAGNDAGSFSGQAVTNNSPEITAPVLQTATVNGSTLTLTYNESLDTGSVPSGSDFSVTVNGNSNTVSTVSVPGGATVVLGLSSAVVQGDTVVISYTGSSSLIQDVAGNDAPDFSGQGVTNNTDNTAPTVTTASSNKDPGTYTIGEVIHIQVDFSEAVTSTGNVTVTLDTGGTCTFTVSNNTSGACDYTVGSSQTSVDLDVSSITGTVKDAALNTMTTPATPTSNLAANEAIVIDTTSPTSFTTGSVITTGGTIVASTWNASNTGVDVTVPVANDASLTGGTIQLRAEADGSFVNLGSAYTILVGDLNANKTISINAATLEAITGFSEGDTITFNAIITDLAGNSTTGTVSATGLFVDQTAPIITAVTSSGVGPGAYNEGDVIDVDFTFSEAVTSTGNVTVTLDTGGSCTFSVSNSDTGTCDYTVGSGEISADLNASSITGTVNDGASNALVTPATPTSNLAANEAIVIDTTAPTVSITAPTDTAVVSGASVTLTASASDTNLAGVTFKRASNTVIGSEDTTNPYSISWDTAALLDGAETLIAVARDLAGNYATSSVINVTIDNISDTVPGSEGGGGGNSGGGQSYRRTATADTTGDTSSDAADDSADTDVSDTTTSDTTGNTITRIDTILTSIRTLLADDTPDVLTLTSLITELKGIFGTLESTTTPADTSSSETPTPTTPTFTTNLSLGMNHPEVRPLQQLLNRLGFTVAVTGPGSVGQETTIFGFATEQAVIRLQRFYNITPAVGFFGAVTRGVVNGL